MWEFSGGHQIIEFILNRAYFFVKFPERIKIFLHVIEDPEISWCNSEKFYVQGTEHGLVRHYPVNDGRYQLVYI